MKITKVLGIVLVGIVIMAVALVGWEALRPKPPVVVLTPPPTPQQALVIGGINPPTVRQQWIAKMQAYEKRVNWLNTPTWTVETINTIKGTKAKAASWQVPLVSTGQFGTALLTWQEQRFTIKVLYALQYNVFREVLVVPVVFQVTNNAGETAKFGEVTTLALGKAFIISAQSPVAVPTGLDWKQCAPKYLGIVNPNPSKQWVCTLGQAIERKWPGYTGLVLRRAIRQTDLPTGFILYGFSILPLPSPPAGSKTIPDFSTWDSN